MNRFLGNFLVCISVVYFLVGIFILIDGIVSVTKGGYIDNIILGAMVMIMGPSVSLAGVIVIRSITGREDT